MIRTDGNIEKLGTEAAEPDSLSMETNVDKIGDPPEDDSATKLEPSVPHPTESASSKEKKDTAKAEAPVDDVVPLQDKMVELQISDTGKDIGEIQEYQEDTNYDEDEEVAAISKNAQRADETKDERHGRKKSDPSFFTKVAFRLLPPTLDQKEFLRIIMPDPEEYNYFAYVPAKLLELGRQGTSAALMSFPEPGVADIYIERFNGYIIVDQHGVEYPMEVDFAICQNVPKPCAVDPLAGTYKDSDAWKKFLIMYNESPDGVIGVKPQFTDVKAMSEHVLKELEEKEGKKGKLQSTPLLDSLREKMKSERDKNLKDREDQIRRRKERDRQRALRKEARKEKQEQQKRERKERDRREREQRDKERRERNKKQDDSGKKIEKPGVKDHPEPKTESVPKKVENFDAQGAKPKPLSTNADKAPSSSRNDQRSKNYEPGQDGYKDRDYVPRRNDRRNRNRERDRQSKRPNDQDPAKQNPSSASGGGVGENVQKKPAVTDDNSKTNPPTSEAASDTKPKPHDEGAGKPKTKVVKKVVKIIRVKSSDGVPTEGRVVEKKVIKTNDEKKPSNPGTSIESPSTSKPEQSSKGEAGSSRPSGRPRRGRPDMQIYRPGSLRQGNAASGTSKPSASDNTKDKNGATKRDNDSAKTKDLTES